MIKIAFCDDDSSMLGDLHGLLALYRAEKNKEIKNAFLEYAFLNRQVKS